MAPIALPESLAERAARHVGQAILHGDYPPGTNLPVEAALCRSLRSDFAVGQSRAQFLQCSERYRHHVHFSRS